MSLPCIRGRIKVSSQHVSFLEQVQPPDQTKKCTRDLNQAKRAKKGEGGTQPGRTLVIGEHEVLNEDVHGPLGASGKKFIVCCKEMVRRYHPVVCIVVEPRGSLGCPWDFDSYLSMFEKMGGAPPNLARCREFRDCVNDCHLMDLDFIGNSYT
ncbi:conserved hypothetical protein [Ricinus communis]|uniref:Uncharacterized protein n=1 Tax=Ricinus communis TaxID=3988 RepID=B9RZ51_RICCO|nr:conserved hypothetical protein [Ricinus communis]